MTELNTERRSIPGVSNITITRNGDVQHEGVDVPADFIEMDNGATMHVKEAIAKAFPDIPTRYNPLVAVEPGDSNALSSAVSLEPMTITEKYISDPDAFLTKAKALAADAINNDFPLDTNTTAAIAEDMYVVWFGKVLGNWKALVSTNIVSGRYIEVTYDGNKKQTYIDDYRKASNECVTDTEYAKAHLS